MNAEDFLNISHKPLQSLNPELKSWSKKYDPELLEVKLLKPIIHKGNNFEELLSKFFFLTYGISNYTVSTRKEKKFIKQNKRPVPSGGALYPNELYIYLNRDFSGFTKGIYHYNPYMHSMTLISTNDIDQILLNNVENMNLISQNDTFIFITSLLDKNSYRYGDWSYRIQNLDTGILIQQLHMIANEMGFKFEFYHRFNDLVLNGILNIKEHEGILGICKVNIEPSDVISEKNIPNVDCMQLENLKDNISTSYSSYYKKIISFHRSTFENWKQEEHISLKGNTQTKFLPMCEIKLPLPQKISRIDLEHYLYSRHTTFQFFDGRPITLKQLSDILFNSYNKVNEFLNINDAVEIFLVINNVIGLNQGIYSYNFNNNTLKLYKRNDYSKMIRSLVIHPNLDINNISAIIIPVGNYYSMVNGNNRYFRLINLCAGSYIGSIINFSINLGIGRYPILAYDVMGIKLFLNLSKYSYPLIMYLTGNQKENLMRLNYPMFL